MNDDDDPHVPAFAQINHLHLQYVWRCRCRGLIGWLCSELTAVLLAALVTRRVLHCGDTQGAGEE
jgi:hypothetical protein